MLLTSNLHLPAGIPYRKCGKLIVAVNDSELGPLDDLHKRAKLNNVPDLVMLDGQQIKEIEPYCKVSLLILKKRVSPLVASFHDRLISYSMRSFLPIVCEVAY